MAALAAASQHQRVVMVERFRMPRYKTCGGGLIGVSMKNAAQGDHSARPGRSNLLYLFSAWPVRKDQDVKRAAY